MGNLFKKETLEEMANEELELPDDFKIRDKREKFKFLFPFYRMEVNAFA